MTTYRISNNKRKWSTTPIVEVITDKEGNETEKRMGFKKILKIVIGG